MAGAAAQAVSGWEIHQGLGQYGTDYTKRVLVTAIGLGANLEADASIRMPPPMPLGVR
jgi:hypothetical protein